MFFSSLLLVCLKEWRYPPVTVMKRVFLAAFDNKESEVTRYLELNEFEASFFCTYNAFKGAVEDDAPDLVLIDEAFDGHSGFKLLKELKSTSAIPVIFLGRSVSESDRILSFELGADDYLIIPFSQKELVLRIKAILRRTDNQVREELPSVSFSLGAEKLDVDLGSHRLTLSGNKILLTSAEWRILTLLCLNAGAIVSRRQIMEKCFDYASESYDRVVDTHIKNIRFKLGPNGKEWIETIRGYGYRFHSGK